MKFREIGGAKYGDLTLGTVQLGMPYGLVNDSGQPSRIQATEIVGAALQYGVTAFDTARAYGDSEAVLGTALSGIDRSELLVITKLCLAGLAKTASKSDVRALVDASLSSSCAALRHDRIDVLLLHGWEQRHLCQGAVWERLLQLRAEGRIHSLGASVYEPHEALAALRDPEIHHLQIPINILDWRWKASGVEEAVADRADVAVYARSALLQGVLVHPASRWPQIGGFQASGYVHQLEHLGKQLGRESTKDLCFAYVRSLPWIASVIVGCETLPQLRENVRLFSKPPLAVSEREQLESGLPRAPEVLLNPSRWKQEVARAS